MKKTAAWLVFLGIVSIVLMGCVVARPMIGPPPIRVDVQPLRPGPNFVWIPGYWRWAHSDYVWVTGHWEKDRPGHVWTTGRWERRGNHWVWIEGIWVRR